MKQLVEAEAAQVMMEQDGVVLLQKLEDLGITQGAHHLLLASQVDQMGSDRIR